MFTGHNTFESLESRLCLSGETGLRGDYYAAASEVFSNSSLAVQTTPAGTETDPTVSFAWGNSAPASEMRWSGQVIASQSGSYVFRVTSGAAVRLWVNGQEIINNWTAQSSAQDNASTPITLTAGASYDIRLDVNENGAGAQGVELDWTLPDGTRQVVPQNNLYPFSKPITITSGGIYVGSWEATGSGTAIYDATTQSVTIDDSTVRGSGILIQNSGSKVQLAVLNTNAYGVDPTVAGVGKGDFIYLQGPSSVDIEHDSVSGVGGYGIHIYGFNGTGNQTITILDNSIRNADGRYSDGNGGYENEGKAAHAILVQNVYNIPGMEIGWNQIINAPGQSYVNDVVNLYDVTGTAGSPVQIDNNYIRGLYSLDPSSQYDSGSGITTDGDNDPATESAYVDIHDNEVVSTGSAGIGVPSGHDIQVYNNQLISTGYIQNTVPVFASGTGVYINDLSHAGSAFYNNAAYDNVSAWVEPPHSKQNGGSNAQRKDYSLVSAAPTLTHANAAWSGVVTQATKANEFSNWKANLLQNGISIGVVPIVLSPTQPRTAAMVSTASMPSTYNPSISGAGQSVDSLLLDSGGNGLLLAA